MIHLGKVVTTQRHQSIRTEAGREEQTGEGLTLALVKGSVNVNVG